MRAEHLKLLLQDIPAQELLAHAATQLAHPLGPAEVAAAVAMARLTAFQKPDGGVRGIATGDAFRRLVARALAKQWGTTLDHATRPYQYALQSRAGTDAIVATVRAALDSREDVVVVSLDGRSAYDSISRAAFLVKLQELAPELLPFVRMFYGRPSTYSWWDAAGRRRDVHQAEGCEQGDPLAPALFALGQHGALARAAGDLNPADKLLAFLDDLYVITVASRARLALDTVTGPVEAHCGIASNLGKTRGPGLGGSEGPAPPGLAELGPDVWRGDRPSHERGMAVLGSPVSHTDFVHAWAEHRLLEEQQLLQQLPQLPDLQCSWLLLALCASPRANHALRTVPPAAIASYGRRPRRCHLAHATGLLGRRGRGPTRGCAPRAGDRFPAGSVRWLRSAVGDALGAGGLLGSLGGRLASHGGQAPGFWGALRRNTPAGRGRNGVLSWAIGRMDGSNMHRALGTCTFATVCCCRHCRLLVEQCYGPNLVPMPARGCRRFPVTQTGCRCGHSYSPGSLGTA